MMSLLLFPSEDTSTSFLLSCLLPTTQHHSIGPTFRPTLLLFNFAFKPNYHISFEKNRRGDI